MGSSVDHDLVRRIATLSRLTVSDEEVARFASDLSSILAYMDQLNEVDTDGVEPTAHVLPVHNVLRSDESRPSPGPDAVLHNAPEKQETYFRVPKVLDQESA